MAIGSVLKQVVKELPEEFAMKSESVAPMLLKKGVKAEELEFSELAVPPGKVTKEQLVEAESKRADKFYTKTMTSPNYQSVSLPGGKDNPTYREKVLKFRRQDEEQSRYTSSHFSEEDNYLMHTRVYDEDFDGTPTRVVQEIQSDLHQAGRQQGYQVENQVQVDPKLIQTELDKITQASDYYYGEPSRVTSDDEADALTIEARTTLENLGFNLDDNSSYADMSAEAFITSAKNENAVPKSPFEKTWLKKGIERELSDAVEEGRSQLAIPISGKVDDLVRAPGVQKWYETQVVNTAKKVAKQSGSTFELKTVGSNENSKELVDAHTLMTGRLRSYLAETDEVKAEQLKNQADEAINQVEDLLGESIDSDIEYTTLAKTTLADLTGLEDESVTYAVIKPQGKNVPKFTQEQQQEIYKTADGVEATGLTKLAGRIRDDAKMQTLDKPVDLLYILHRLLVLLLLIRLIKQV